ncbi:MAG: deaminase [Thermoleophilia bacterium]|nr:deaminase [Thermoleophilia bacterium]
MGRTVYWVNVSLDGYIELSSDDHVAEVGDLAEAAPPEWARIDEQVYGSFNEQLRGLALMIEGRVTYEMLELHWPGAANDPSLPAHLREFGRIWTEMPKVMVSRTRSEADHNTRVVGGDDAIEQLAALRDETDGAIGVGGATLATQLLEAGLLDELLLYVHPAVLGTGRPMFDRLRTPVLSDLLDARDFDNGVSLRRYSVGRSQT